MTYKATDSHGASVSKTFTIAVSNPTNLPPVYNGGIPAEVDLYAPKGKTDSYTFPSTAFSSPAGEALTYKATTSGGGALPSFLTFNGATRTFTTTSVLNDRDPSITLTATDTRGRSVSHTFTANGTYGTHHYAYVNGQQIGDVDKAGNIDVLSGVTGFSSSDTGTGNCWRRPATRCSPSRSKSMAMPACGSGGGCQRIRCGDRYPTAGQTLKLPQAETNSNPATTFKPYNPNEISGSTTPSLPQAPQPAPSAQHCNTLAEIVVIAVVIVASIYTGGRRRKPTARPPLPTLQPPWSLAPAR